MADISFLEKEGPITLDDLKANFRANDFSAYSSGFSDKHESVERTERFQKIREYFEAAWSDQLKVLTGKSMQNFTEHSAVGSLEKSEGNLVAGTLVDVLENEQQAEMLLELGLQVLREPLEMELEQLALAQGKAPEELSEEEFSVVLAQLSDQFLGKMMNLLLQTQDIEQWMEFTKQTPVHEDFNEKILLNFDKINFERRWDHLRTRIGRLFELDEAIAETYCDPNSERPLDAVDMGLGPAETDEEACEQLLSAFIATVQDPVDQEILYLRARGWKQKEIAEHLQFKDHTNVCKRLTKLQEQCHAFLAQLK